MSESDATKTHCDVKASDHTLTPMLNPEMRSHYRPDPESWDASDVDRSDRTPTPILNTGMRSHFNPPLIPAKLPQSSP
jgi:hypothetical protein